MNTAKSQRNGRNESLRDTIHADLQARIHAGDVGPDERLVDTDIASRLGVSRMPVREALMRLVHEGYLVATTRGFMLPRLTAEDIADIFEVRRLLEPRAAAHAARDIDGPRLAILEAASRDAAAAATDGDAERLHHANVTFRAAWLSAVSNTRLAAAIERFADHVQVVRLATLGDRPTQRLVAEGLAGLHEAFSARDSVAAADRMVRFMDHAERAFAALAPPRTDGRDGMKRR
jgi:DNA-binding GntR family transcriptional regulator